MTAAAETTTALVLSGGGARAAYEAGVLKALAEWLPPGRSPFSIYCGSSGGAINAAGLALAADFRAGADALTAFWARLRSADVYRVDPGGAAVAIGRWLAGLAAGWLFGSHPRALFDNAPLGRLLAREFDFAGLEPAVASHALRALSITCSGYASGQSVSFFQGRHDLEPWQGRRRVGAHVALGVEHVLASMATPILFPAVKLHREFFGDGAMRNLAPLSPAAHLGADRILAVGTERVAAEPGERTSASREPTLAEVSGHMLSGMYSDGLAADAERVDQINRLVATTPGAVRRKDGLRWRPIRLMVIEPSEPLDVIAARHVACLPLAVRSVLRSFGTASGGMAALASYLLFDTRYTAVLIDRGYRDAMTRRGEIAQFLGNLDFA